MIDNSNWTVQERISYLYKCTAAEWEEICKGCGICCLVKYETRSGKTAYTRLACDSLDLETKKCRNYNKRLECDYCNKVNLNTVLTGKEIPDSCGYVEFIYGPAKYPAKVDFTKVTTGKNVDLSNIFQVVTKYIRGSKKWNSR